jgi:hypothetical protein
VDGKYIKDQRNDRKSSQHCGCKPTQLNKSECAKTLRLSVCEGARGGDGK